jgi:hypothetical protein
VPLAPPPRRSSTALCAALSPFFIGILLRLGICAGARGGHGLRKGAAGAPFVLRHVALAVRGKPLPLIVPTQRLLARGHDGGHDGNGAAAARAVWRRALLMMCHRVESVGRHRQQRDQQAMMPRASSNSSPS